MVFFIKIPTQKVDHVLSVNDIGSLESDDQVLSFIGNNLVVCKARDDICQCVIRGFDIGDSVMPRQVRDIRA
jgi:hypothetical protein